MSSPAKHQTTTGEALVKHRILEEHISAFVCGERTGVRVNNKWMVTGKSSARKTRAERDAEVVLQTAVSIARGWFSLLCHLVDDRGKVGGSVELHFPQTVVIRLQHAFDADAVGVLAVGVLRSENTHASVRGIIHVDFYLFKLA